MTAQVLASPFLLGLIFLQLPQQDLLLVQRVCRIWRITIQGSKTLLNALFLCSLPANDRHQPVQLNPLLQARFSSFFDSEWQTISTHRAGHCMGPWYTTEWAEDIRPWPHYSPHPPGLPASNSLQIDLHMSMVEQAEQINLDPERTAAYRRPEASWRRMLPCLPAPAMLQISEDTTTLRLPRQGKLRSLTFADEEDGGIEQAGGSHKPVLTFGFIYDIVVDAWFYDRPIRTIQMQFDWSFDDEPGRSTHGSDSPYNARQRIRQALPDHKVGGPGCVLIMLRDFQRGSRTFPEKRFREEFTINSATVNMWDEEVDYTIGS